MSAPHFVDAGAAAIVNKIQAELELRWRKMFSSLRDGGDIPPSNLLRAEGLMEAVVIAGALTSLQVQERMAVAFREVYGMGLTQAFGEDWREFYPFPQIPFAHRRAPVYPSTSD